MKKVNKKNVQKTEEFTELNLSETAMTLIAKSVTEINQIKQGLNFYVNGVLAGMNIEYKTWKLSNDCKKILIQK